MNIKSAFSVFLVGVVSTLAVGICVAQEGVRWESLSLQAAQQRASQTRRLVLVHFWSPNCGPCQKMERLVFSRPDVAAAVEAAYVPVKINVDQFPYTARQFGITALPTDLILSPEGQVIRRFQGAVPADQYIGQLQRIAMEMQVAGVGGPMGLVGYPSYRGGASVAEGRPLPDGQLIQGGYPLPVGQPMTESQFIAGPANTPAWPASWTPASGFPDTPRPSYSGYQNPSVYQKDPVVAPVGERYAGIPSGQQRVLDPQSNAPPVSEWYAGAHSGVQPLSGSSSGSGSSFGGVSPIAGPGGAENSYLPLADRTMGFPPGAFPSAPSSSPPSSLNSSAPSHGDAAGKPTSADVPTMQRGISMPSRGGTDIVRADAPHLGGGTSPAGSGTPMTDTARGPSGEPVAADWPPGLPPLGLEGYCPVSLVEKRRWVLGTHPWGVIHEGRTYMCAGPEEQKKFLANPERYGPVLSGHDVVWAVERGQQVLGRREYGVFYRDRVYLFAEPATLDAFRKNPRQYLETISSFFSPAASETAPRR